MNVSRRSAAIVLVASLSAGIIAGVAGLAIAQDQPPAEPYMQLTREGFPTNEFGLSVGKPTVADIDAQNLPDLVEVEGERGYLKSAEVYFPDPKSPEEAVEQTNRLVNDKGEIVTKLYAADGKTVVGQFIFGTVAVDAPDTDR